MYFDTKYREKCMSRKLMLIKKILLLNSKKTKMKKLNILFLLTMVLLSFNGFAQSKIFDNVLDFEIRSTLEITNNKQIVGYGVFYKKDKMKNSALFG
jgi:hypothetical protein